MDACVTCFCGKTPRLKVEGLKFIFLFVCKFYFTIVSALLSSCKNSVVQ